jgi:hypothetical protein
MGHERSSTTLDLYTRRTDDHSRILQALVTTMTSADNSLTIGRDHLPEDRPRSTGI